MPSWKKLESLPTRIDEIVTVRRAEPGDLNKLAALQEDEQSVFDIAMAHSLASLDWIHSRNETKTGHTSGSPISPLCSIVSGPNCSAA